MRMTPLLNKHWKKYGCSIAVFGFSKCHRNPTFGFLTLVRFSKTDSEPTLEFPHIPSLIYINDNDDSRCNKLLKFAGDTKVFSVVSDRNDIDRLHNDLDARVV